MWIDSCSLVLLIIGGTYAALPLPSYIQPCALNEPNFYECSLEHAKAAIPTFAKGLKKYGIPSFIPLEIPEIKIENGPSQAGINLHLKNVKVYYLEKSEATNIHFDVEHSQNVFEITAPLLTVTADYEISGRLILLPITGHGTINVTGINYKLRLDADSKIEERDGVRFGVFFNPRLTGKPSKEFFTLTNLFNGDKLLGEEMNNVMNENWQDVHRELVVPVLQSVGVVLISFINNFAKNVPYDVWFPEKV